MIKKYSPLILKIVISIILIQTLFFKFTGAQESVDLFTKIVGEDEAAMRIGTGILELIASILLFIPKRTWLGAILAFSIMGGAIMSHLTIIGIEHNNDNGALFSSAIIVLIFSFILLCLNLKSIPFISHKS